MLTASEQWAEDGRAPQSLETSILTKDGKIERTHNSLRDGPTAICSADCAGTVRFATRRTLGDACATWLAPERIRTDNDVDDASDRGTGSASLDDGTVRRRNCYC